MINVLITGCNGQLGSEMSHISKNHPEINFFFKGRSLDISDSYKVESYMKENKINFIINTAAYTNVNNAEVEKEKADKTNEFGVKNLVELCEKYNCKLIHFSTDYVYFGKSITPLDEKSLTNPQNYYGISKRNGEKYIENSSSESIIIRTSWLYSKYGDNFVNTILKKIDNREKICVVNDQFGCPTNAVDLASDTFKIMKSKMRLDKHGKIYNYSNLGYTTWSNFAKKIIEFIKIKYHVHEVSTNDLESKVIRPRYSITDKNKIIKTFNLKIPFWENSLKTYLTNFRS